MKTLSVIIPALNEERYIGYTLRRLDEAARNLQFSHTCPVQVIVVDNDSEDQTALVARGSGATVLPEPIRNISRARNTGARVAGGEVLFFLDADTLVPPSVLSRVAAVMSEPLCLGGGVDVQHLPSRALVRHYLSLWRVIGRLGGMAQGAAQFWRREEFLRHGGFDETIYMGEDVDFYWRMKRVARKQGRKVSYISDVRVAPSSRRFDHWPLWKTLLWTNPVVVALFYRHKRLWRGWYENVPR